MELMYRFKRKLLLIMIHLVENMLGTLTQRIFPKLQLPKGIFPSGNFPNVHRPVTRGGCKGAGAPPFLLKGGCNDEFAPLPPVPYKRNFSKI